MRWDAARDLGHLVPNERFFVRNHAATPRIDDRDGSRQPLTVPFDDAGHQFGAAVRHPVRVT
jgi:hypothetical protein